MACPNAVGGVISDRPVTACAEAVVRLVEGVNSADGSGAIRHGADVGALAGLRRGVVPVRANRLHKLFVNLIQIDPERAVARVAADAIALDLAFRDQVSHELCPDA